MTEWHGIKLGGLYKRIGMGSRGAPMELVVGIETGNNGYCRYVDSVAVTTLREGKLWKAHWEADTFMGPRRHGSAEEWKSVYKEVA